MFKDTYPIATGIDSSVYAEDGGIVKFYKSRIGFELLQKYHMIQSSVSKRLEKKKIQISGNTLRVLDLGEVSIHISDNGELMTRPKMVKGWNLYQHGGNIKKIDGYEKRNFLEQEMSSVIGDIRTALEQVLKLSYPVQCNGNSGICATNITLEIDSGDFVITDLGNDIQDFVRYNQRILRV